MKGRPISDIRSLTMSVNEGPKFVTLGMFIIDEFEFSDEGGKPIGRAAESQAGNFAFLLTELAGLTSS